jgi:hypothetical protein
MTYADLISYFERVQQSSRTLLATYVGDYDRIYDLINNSDEFLLPSLWLESAEMTPVGTADASTDQWNIALTVIYKGTPQNKDVNQYQIEQSYRVARRILARLSHDTTSGALRANIINKSLSMIDPLSADWLVGWRIELTIDTRSVYGCYDADDWDESVGVTDAMYFDANVSGDDLTIVTKLPASIGWTWQLMYSINGGAMLPVTGLTVPNGAVSHTYITITGTHTSGHVRVASIFRNAGALPASVRSVPYLYNQYNQG